MGLWPRRSRRPPPPNRCPGRALSVGLLFLAGGCADPSYGGPEKGASVLPEDGQVGALDRDAGAAAPLEAGPTAPSEAGPTAPLEAGPVDAMRDSGSPPPPG